MQCSTFIVNSQSSSNRSCKKFDMQRTSGAGFSLSIILLFVSLSGCIVASQNFIFHLCRYEWQHKGSSHIVGFIWLENAPDMDNLNWNDQVTMDRARSFFDEHISAWNPRPLEQCGPYVHISTENDPCILPSPLIFASSRLQDYDNLLNCVQRHTKCHLSSYLRQEGSTLVFHYGVPQDLNPSSSLIIDDSGQNKCVLAHNDDRLDVHNSNMLYIWRANIDCQSILSWHVVLRYIARHASKPETKLENCWQMLSRVSEVVDPKTHVVNVVRIFLT